MSGPPTSPQAEGAPALNGLGIYTDEFSNMSMNSTTRELPTVIHNIF